MYLILFSKLTYSLLRVELLRSGIFDIPDFLQQNLTMNFFSSTRRGIFDIQDLLLKKIMINPLSHLNKKKHTLFHSHRILHQKVIHYFPNL